MLRARAIECNAYVFAPAQYGRHPGGRKTYGRSLIINPWGELLADDGEQPGIVMTNVEPAKAKKARYEMPSLHDDRPYSISVK